MMDERTLDEKIKDKKALVRVALSTWKAYNKRAKGYRRLLKELKKELAALEKKRKANERAQGKV